MTVNNETLAPIPIAITSIATAANPGVRNKVRAAYRTHRPIRCEPVDVLPRASYRDANYRQHASGECSLAHRQNPGRNGLSLLWCAIASIISGAFALALLRRG